MFITIQDITKLDQPAQQIKCTYTGIYTDLQKSAEILLQNKQNAYIFRLSDGLPRFLKVKEYISYIASLANKRNEIDHFIEMLQLSPILNIRISKLDESWKNVLRFVLPFFYAKDALIIEEPFNRLQSSHKELIAKLIQHIATNITDILFLSNNLEDLLYLTNEVYRYDHSGLHLLDLVEEESTNELPEPEIDGPIKIDKIQGKYKDNIILFNPPEIDFIESVDGQIQLVIGNKRYSTSFTLTELEKRLVPFGFYRCHRSYIVNLQKIREIITWSKNSYSLKLHNTDESIVPLSRTKLPELKELLSIS